jgi:hypothetical protein
MSGIARASKKSSTRRDLIELDESTGHSRFDGAYLNARQRPRRGIAFDVAYTHARVRMSG